MLGRRCIMPKKTTKTAHVMNLLTKSDSVDVKAEQNETITNEEINDLSNQKAKEETLNDKINQELANALEEELLAEETATEPEEIVPEKEISQVSVKEFTPEVIVTKPQEPEQEPTPDPSKAPVAPQPIARQPIPKDILIDENHICVNVMEELILISLDKFMDTFDLCKCQYCRSDVLAYSLNLLPPKYVATNKGKLFTKLATCEHQYSTDITSALTKACMVVKAHPRH